MAKIPAEVRDLLTEGHSVWVATLGEDGMPNIAVKRSATLLDEEHVYVADMFRGKTHDNLAANHRAAIGVYDSARGIACQLKGRVDLIEDGGLVERASARLSDLNDRLPPVKYVARMTVESVWNMAAGRHAGEMIEERAA
jgi:predicted pyridoxine 5'-phosphate oxidase superfamily flavin-nucleotide-binding protein